MAKCENCGKTTTFGHNRSFSLRATNRAFRPNLQKVTVIKDGRKIKQTLCAKCIRKLAKTQFCDHCLQENRGYYRDFYFNADFNDLTAVDIP